MSAGVAFGALADALGPRRSMLLGLGLLALASGAGGAGAGCGRRCCCCARVEGFGFLLVVLPAPGLIRRLVAPAAAQPHARPVGHLHALRRGAGAADRAGVDRRLRLARLVVGAGRRCRRRWRCGWRGPCPPAPQSRDRRSPAAALGRAAAPDAGGARALAGGDDLRGLCRAVAGGHRLPAGHLPGGGRAPAPPPACSPRWPRRSTWPATWPRAGCCMPACGRRGCWPPASSPWRWPRRRPLQSSTARPAAGAALCGGPGVLGGRRADPGDAVRAGACAWRPASRRCPAPSAGCSSGRPWASLPARRWWPGWPAAAAAGNGPGWPPRRARCSACCWRRASPRCCARARPRPMPDNR